MLMRHHQFNRSDWDKKLKHKCFNPEHSIVAKDTWKYDTEIYSTVVILL